MEEAALAAVTALPATLGSPSAVADAYQAFVTDTLNVGVDTGRLVVEAGAGHDNVQGSRIGYNELHGGSGMDYLYAGGFVSELHGEADSDYVSGGGLKSYLYGGSGADIFNVAANSFVMDATTEDYVTWGPFRLTGGSKQYWMEAGWAYYQPFTAVLQTVGSPAGVGGGLFAFVGNILDTAYGYGFRYATTQGGQLIIQNNLALTGQAIIDQYKGGPGYDFDAARMPGDITVYEQQVTFGRDHNLAAYQALVNLALKAGFGTGIYGTDPLMLDLDGDGLELIRRDLASVYFDLDGDNFAERTAWTRNGDDGFLVRDLNGNGSIDGVAEMFGDATTPGFTALAALDGNADGKITSADAGFSTLRVWRDLNGDGVTDAGELATLAETGITEISVTATQLQNTSIRDSDVRAQATFTRTDGSTSTISDVVLFNSETDTRYLGDTTVSTAAAALPDLRGYGNVTGLRIAMTADATLLGQVTSFAGATGLASWTAVRDQVAGILYRWAGVDGVAATSLGGDFDTRKLAFLETYLGYELAPRNGQGQVQTGNYSELVSSWNDVLDKAAARLAAQGPFAAVFQALTFDTAEDRFAAPAVDTLDDILGAAIATLPTDPTAAAAAWNGLYGPMIAEFMEALVRHDGNATRADFAVKSLLAALEGAASPLSLAQLVTGLGFEGVHIGTAGNDAIVRGTGRDTQIYVGGAGNDTLTGGAGQDVYVFGSGFGIDTIYDAEAGGRDSGDRLRFATLNQSDVTIGRQGFDLVVSVNGSTDKVIVQDYFSTPVMSTSGGQLTEDFGIEDIQFADGTILEAGEVALAVGNGTDQGEVLNGSGIGDYLTAKKGDDTIRGSDGGDNYIYTKDDGHDVIQDVMTNPLLGAPDSLLLLGGIGVEDLHFARDGKGTDLTITFGWSGDSVTIEDQFAYTALGYTSMYAPDNRIEAVSFQFGQSLSWLDLQRLTIATYTTAGNDATYGFGTPDELFASAGNDTLSALDGGDIYHFDQGSGQDVIDDASEFVDTPFSAYLGYTYEADDTLVFGEGIAVADVSFSRLTSAPDLLISFAGLTDTVTVTDQFQGIKLDLFNLLGIGWFGRIENFQFADGTVLTWEDVLGDVTTGKAGNDSLWGAYYADAIEGKAGDDYLSGGDDGDTYVFGAGFGHDTIDDLQTNILTSASDTVLFGAGIGVGDVTFQRDGTTKDLLVTVQGSDTIRIKNQYSVAETGPFGPRAFNEVERFEWADGTVKTFTEISAAIIAAAKTPGADLIVGTHFDDTLDGGAGNDTLIGENGSDTYLINAGDGQDLIADRYDNILADNADRIVFGTGLSASNVTVTRTGGGLADAILTFSSGQSVTIEDQFFYTSINYSPGEIETITFTGGPIWTAADLRATYLAQAQTSGNDTIDGFWTDDSLSASAGNDLLRGGDGSDTYHFGIGAGHDTIEEHVLNVVFEDDDAVVFDGLASSSVTWSRNAGGNDLIAMVNGSDVLTMRDQLTGTFTDIERFVFTDTTLTAAAVSQLLIDGARTTGADVIRGDQLDNTLDGGAGNDTLTGGNGNDSYVFTLGTGQERIDDQNTSVLGSTADRIQFGAGIAFANLSASRVGNDLVITINGTSDSLTIVNQYGAGGRIEAFVFADGSVRTASDVGALSLQSTSGNDTINGTNGDDAIDGGAGNDALAGGEGNDAYAFRRSSGQDTITDGNLNILSSDADSVSFGVGIVRDDLILSRSGNNLVIDIAGSPADRLTIVGQLASASSANGNRIESFQFADGSVVAAGEIEKALLAGTAGSDVLIGFTSNDTLDGGNGSDTLIGGVGDDTYVFGAGYGHDSIDDQNTNILSSEADRITFKAGITPAGVTLQRVGNDLVLTTGAGDQLTVKGQFGVASASRIETFEFADGTVWDWALVNAELLKSTAGADTINGYAGADTIDGGAGNDTLAGKEGDDTYVFDRGYGHDTINDGNLSALTSYADTVVFRSGIGVDDLTFARAGDNLVIGISGTADQLTVVGQFTNVVPDTISSSRIETLVFADGGQLTAAEIDARLLAATAGNDTIVGYNSVEALDGGAGNDTLNGGSGADAYVFGRGYGVDVIEDNALSVLTSDGDRVMFRPDIAPGDLEYSRGGSYLEDLVIRVAGSTDQLTVRNSLTASISDTIETFEFADGTALSIDDIKRILLAGTQEAETLNGFTGSADVLDGKAGNDLLKGDTGSDTYVFARGYGDDIIDDLDGSADVLTFGPLVASTDVTFHRLGSDLAVAIAGTADIVRIAGYYANGFKKIESFVFSDTTLNSAQAEARAVADTLPGVTHQGTPSADVLSGSTGDDAFQGGLGNDTINSAGGNDTFLYASGDGNDIVNETGGAQAQTDTLQLTNLTPDGVSLTRNGNHLLVNVTATSQTVQVTDQFLSTAAYTGIDQLKFADGTTWDRATILANTVIVGTADNDTLNGFATADKFRGLAGNDTINSGAGADTVYYASGDGNDLVNETGGVVGDTDGLQLTDINAASILLTRSANNLLVGITATGQTIQVKDQFLGSAGNPGIDQLAFADGTIWNRSQIGANAWYRGTAGIDSMLGSDLDDTYYGGTGNDSIDSRVGSDTFIYYAGDGNDWINEENSSTVYVDTLKLMDLSAVDIKLSHVGTDLMIDILPTGERVEIDEHFWSTTSNYGIERIEFADGSNWDRSTINANTWYYGTAANNTITGSNFADNIDGDAGNDTISGGVGADFIQGGLGNDSLTGGAGDDVFSFASAFGLDKLNDFKDNATESDIIEFQASAFGSFAEVQAAMTQSSTSVLITHSPGNVLTITNATLANFGADDFRFVT
ncbi:MAG: calcium-binding protein [Hyphomicrobiaceae bacterium]|nr:calcium-binding protein [Hyphomicrobiaceae bacterium]